MLPVNSLSESFSPSKIHFSVTVSVEYIPMISCPTSVVLAFRKV